jgi:hypothetical protein
VENDFEGLRGRRRGFAEGRGGDHARCFVQGEPVLEPVEGLSGWVCFVFCAAVRGGVEEICRMQAGILPPV